MFHIGVKSLNIVFSSRIKLINISVLDLISYVIDLCFINYVLYICIVILIQASLHNL
jgi:hypothetical protein